MKKATEALVVVEMAIAIAVLAIVGLCGVARAEPVQQMTMRLETQSGGRLGMEITTRTYDTTGVVPPRMTDYYARLPVGMGVRKQFRTARWQCDGPALRDTIDDRPSAVPFWRRVANLKPLIRSLARGTSKASRTALANVRVCDRARLGGGTAKIDGRNVTDTISELIPVRFSMFLSRATVPGAIAGYTILGSAELNAPIVRRFPVIAGVHAVVTDSILDDPTPDGLYGYKLLLPEGPINGFDISIAEVRAKVRTPTIPQGTCLRSGRRGRCAARQKADLHAFVAPTCPPAGLLSALLFVGYAPPLQSITTTLQLPCPRFRS